MDSESIFEDHSFAISSFSSDISSPSFTTFLNIAHDSLDYHRENNRRKLDSVRTSPKRKIRDDEVDGGDDGDLVQLLIHTSAPSAAKDDTLYRKQAEAVFRGFEVGRRVEIGKIERPRKKRKLSEPTTPVQTPLKRRGSIHSQTAYLVSFSSDEGLDATVGEIVTKDIETIVKSEPLLQRPENEIIPSKTVRGQSEENQNLLPKSQRQSQQVSQACPLVHNYVLPDDSWEPSSYSIPDSYQAPACELSQTEQEGLLQADCELQSSLAPVGEKVINLVPCSQPGERDPKETRTFIYSIPPPSKDSLTQLSSISTGDIDTQRSGLSTPDRSKRLPPFTPFPEPSLYTLVKEPQIIPPPPETNANPPLITPYLQKLQEGKIWEKYYRPSIKRELQDMERGCWVIDTSGWTRKEKLEFWSQIKLGIETGRCGAVTVFITQDNDREKNVGFSSIGRKRAGDRVQVFCWGKAAELMWGFLLVFSSMKTKTGIYWEDAKGEVIVQC